MKTFVVVAIGVALVALAGCTLGLTPEQAAQVKRYEQTMADKRAELAVLQGRLEALTKLIAESEGNSEKIKTLLKERDEVVALISDATEQIKKIAEATQDLKDQGVPAWSIALNGLEQLALILFGGGGVLSGVIAGLKNARLKKVATTMIGAIENDVDATVSATVKKAVKDKANAEGTEPLLNSLVKKAGG